MALPVIPLIVARKVTAPKLTPVASPSDPPALLIVAVAADVVVHVTEVVIFAVEESE